MRHIVARFSTFTLLHDVMVYSDGDCVEFAKVPIDNIVDTIRGLQSKYNVQQIDLCGNLDYILKYKAELQLKFANLDVEINTVAV